MSTVLIAEQEKLPYLPLQNVAQVNDAITTYTGNETIVAGLNAIKTAMIAAISNAKDCVQCTATGKVDAGANICPLCEGMTKTSGQYTVAQQLIGYNTPA